MTKPADVDAYIDAAPAASQSLLRELRKLIFEAAPLVTERISYGMPTYDYRGKSLLNFSAAKSHVGVYGLVHVDGQVPPELADYFDHRSTLRFKFDRPLPTAALKNAIVQKAERLDDAR